MWTKPAFSDLRIGFEVTMYFANPILDVDSPERGELSAHGQASLAAARVR